MILFGVSWDDYVLLRDTLDMGGLKMTYCEGTLELMSPSRLHELWKTSIARMIELYALEKDWPLNGYGSTTFRRRARERGLEPDECYCVGRIMKDRGRPHIALEVIHTSPLVDKLNVYRGLEVPEVWFFVRGAFELHRLERGRYRSIDRSRFLPELDFSLVTRFASREDQHEALKELRAILGSPNAFVGARGAGGLPR
jgi:Uma2 family endonuclease